MNDARWDLLLDPDRRRKALAAWKAEFRWPRLGRVRRVQGARIEVEGLEAVIGEACRIEAEAPLEAEVLAFRDRVAWLLPVGDARGLAPGVLVRPLGEPPSVAVAEALCGRVIDAMAQPIDGKGALESAQWLRVPVRRAPPAPIERAPIRRLLPLGVRVIDACLPVGVGQRVGLFAGAGVGKTTLLAMIARHARAARIVIALIGERGREVRAFLDALDDEAKARAVIVVATADRPPLWKVRAALVATAIAEFFRDRGEDVLLLMDSLTRLLQAQREIGLLLDEPPTTKGYPPSCFSLLAETVERAGATQKGSISAIYTVLVEGDDLRADPVADAAIAVLDGHIVLSRRLAERSWFPAVDLLASVSRIDLDRIEKEQRAAIEVVRRALAAYEEVAEMVALGVYRAGSNPWVDRTIAHWAELEAFFRQSPEERADAEESARRLLDLARKLGEGGAR